MRMSTLVAFFAAIMLVIGGALAPAQAADLAACDPCPADCPMMAGADHAGADRPSAPSPDASACDQDLACPGAGVASLCNATADFTVLALGAADLDRLEPLAAASRPPDRNLRPPIQL